MEGAVTIGHRKAKGGRERLKERRWQMWGYKRGREQAMRKLGGGRETECRHRSGQTGKEERD